MGKCIRCGKTCPDNENMCDDCRARLEEKTKGSTVSGAGQEQKPKKGPILWIILAAVAVIAAVVIIAALSGRGEKKKGKNVEPAMEALTAGVETTEAAESVSPVIITGMYQDPFIRAYYVSGPDDWRQIGGQAPGVIPAAAWEGYGGLPGADICHTDRQPIQV